MFQLDLELQDLVLADLLFPSGDATSLEIGHHQVDDSFPIPPSGMNILTELFHVATI